MKLILSTIVTGIVLFLLGWLFYGVLFTEIMKEYFGHISRPEADMKIWVYAVASFSQAFFLFLIYSKMYKGGSPAFEGIRFGILIGLFWVIPYMCYTWGGMPVKYTGVIYDGAIGFVTTLIACILTAVIHGRKEVKA